MHRCQLFAYKRMHLTNLNVFLKIVGQKFKIVLR